MSSGDSPLTRKLSYFATLSKSDQCALDTLSINEEHFLSDVDIAIEGVVPRCAFVIKTGMAFRYRDLQDGNRQIISFLLPGDLCDWQPFANKAKDHTIGTLTPVTIAVIQHNVMAEILSYHPHIFTALWCCSLQDNAILRERIVSLGRRNARSRVAHLLCEFLWRNEIVGLAERQRFFLPLTQTELGDTLGLTPVTVNRVLKEFRQNALISIQGRIIAILDVAALQEIASFTDSYLKLSGDAERLGVPVGDLARRRIDTAPVPETTAENRV